MPRPRPPLVLMLILFALGPSVPQGQLPGLRRPVRDAGLEARSTMRGAGGQTAAELRRRSSAASEEAATLNNQHSDDRSEWVNANGAAENCVSEELTNAEQRHQQEMQQRFMGMTGVNTPEKTKFMQDWTAAGQEVQQAAM